MLFETFETRARAERARCRGERDILHATHNAKCAKASVTTLLEQRKMDLEKEINSKYPDVARIQRIKRIIANLEWSLTR